MADERPESPVQALVERVAEIERRLQRVEEHLKVAVSNSVVRGQVPHESEAAQLSAAPVERGDPSDDEFEYQVGQSWFAKLGIFVLAVGIAFTLSRPFTGLPAALPSIIGFALVAVLAILARAGRRSFEMLSEYLLGAAMALAAFSTFRLFYFGDSPVFATDSWTGRSLLVVVAAANLAVSIYRKAPHFAALSLLIGCVIAAVIPSDWFSVLLVLAVCVCAVAVAVRFRWPMVLVLLTPLTFASYLSWLLQPRYADPLHGAIREPGAQIFLMLGYVLVLAGGSLFRPDRDEESQIAVLHAVMNCGAGYLIFLFHAFAASGDFFIVSNFGAAAVFLAISVAFWVRERSQISTFFYAMTGYLAVTVAIIRAFGQPEVFVWLSVQSILVVFTAVWFRSRFIVVANFLIFLAIVGSYVVTTREESGISLVFGLVALSTARFLNWKKANLELKTEFMRNAYLLTTFILFPYALYHLLPRVYVALSWTGMALLYYLLSHLVGTRKYRWMGHGTLLLAAVYLVAIGIQYLDPTLRSVSLLALGVVLLSVSVVFTIIRARQRAAAPDQEEVSDDAAGAGR